MVGNSTPYKDFFTRDVPFCRRFCYNRFIYIICSLKQQYREICVKMQQYLCELHLCMDGGGECGLVIMKRIAS